jgi:hypothetical protein
MTAYGLDDRSSIRGRDRDQTKSGAHSASYPVDIGGFTRGG